MQGFLHESGHLWSNSGYDFDANDGCLEHVNLGNGKGYYKCFWQAVCINTSNNDLTPDEYVSQLKSNPNFCEGHQQIFMNRLKSRN